MGLLKENSIPLEDNWLQNEKDNAFDAGKTFFIHQGPFYYFIR
jgi:hypothetical protein